MEKSQKCNHNEYEKLKKCYLCDFAFSRSCHLRTHLKKTHWRKAKKCNLCDLASFHANNLTRHLNRHSGEKPKNATNANMHSLGQAIWGDLWKSTMGKSRTTATCVTLHPLGHAIWGHIWKTYWRKVKKCNECDLASFQANILTRHLNRYSVKIHSWEKSNNQCLLPGKRFEETFKDAKWRKCNQCEYASSQASNLKLHLKTHSGEKSNKCNQCDYASSQASDLICLHIWKHTGEKSIKCNQCDYGFRQTIWKSTVEVFCNQPRVFTPVRVANVPTPQCKCTTIISDQQFLGALKSTNKLKGHQLEFGAQKSPKLLLVWIF